MLTTREAADELGCSVATVTRLILKGQLTAERLTLGRTSPYAITEGSVNDFKHQRRICICHEIETPDVTDTP